MYEEFENEKKKEQNFFDLPEPGFEPQIFSNFSAHDLNYHGKCGSRDQIKTSFQKFTDWYQFGCGIAKMAGPKN